MTPKKKLLRNTSFVSLLGPAFVAAIAYVDPGNFATNLSAGSLYGYSLIWVLVIANVMAGLVQYLSAKAGLVTGKSLPELVRDQTSGFVRIAYWAQAELVAIATDLAEVLGGAIALTLLFGIPLLVSGILTGLISLLILTVQTRKGQRPFEWIITALLLGIGITIIVSLFFTHISFIQSVKGLLPRIQGSGSLFLIAGMFGATIMPHVVYLHSALARDRHGKQIKESDSSVLTHLLKVTRIDVFIAMLFAGGVNIAMLLLAAGALRGMTGVDTLIGAHTALVATLGTGVGLLFAIGLLISGLASTSVGSYAGVVIMEGLLNYRIPLFLRRIITILPALILLSLPIQPTQILILSQVVLSFGIPFAVIPLARITANKATMGEYVNSKAVNICMFLSTALVVAINIVLLCSAF